MVNILAVVVASVVSMVLGMLWYGPFFGKQWMSLMKLTKLDMEKSKKKGMTTTYILAFLTTFIMSIVLGYLIELTNILSTFGGVVVGSLVWLGFLATTLAGSVLWENKPWALYFLNAGHYLLTLVVMGAILGAWN